MIRTLLLAAVALATLSATPDSLRPPPEKHSQEATATYQDIQATLGSVPEFFKLFPDYAISGAWAEMKGVQLNPHSAIPPKYKELIGLAVAAQVPCRYCVYFHTATAKLNGASDDEIKHVLAEASLTRHWSTWLNGKQPDEEAFRSEIERALARKDIQPSAGREATPITDADSARKDIEATWGFVPQFLAEFPPEGLAGAWKEMKAVEMNPNAPLPPKYLSLAGVAVAAQIPCRYCVTADTMFAERGNGASAREVDEAIAVSAEVRHWSTFLNGDQVDEAKFRRDVDQVVTALKKRSTK